MALFGIIRAETSGLVTRALYVIVVLLNSFVFNTVHVLEGYKLHQLTE
jgi:hypothetical protein